MVADSSARARGRCSRQVRKRVGLGTYWRCCSFRQRTTEIGTAERGYKNREPPYSMGGVHRLIPLYSFPPACCRRAEAARYCNTKWNGREEGFVRSGAPPPPQSPLPLQHLHRGGDRAKKQRSTHQPHCYNGLRAAMTAPRLLHEWMLSGGDNIVIVVDRALPLKRTPITFHTREGE